MRRLVAAVGAILVGIPALVGAASAGPAAASSARAVPPAPKVGDCWHYDNFGEAFNGASSPAKRVPCSGPHNAVTTAVATIPSSVKHPSWDPEKAAAAAHLACDSRGFTGQSALGLPATRPLRVEGYSFVPSDAQWAAGQRWTRCDTVIPNGSSLDVFPSDLAAWAADATASGRCYDANPATADWMTGAVRRCDGTETWTAPLWVPVSGTAFPGRADLVQVATQQCAPLAQRQRQWDATFPTARNWAMGYRGVMCLVGPVKTSA
jgi:hypothetical protein